MTQEDMPIPIEPTFILTVFDMDGHPDVMDVHHMTYDVRTNVLTFDRAAMRNIPDLETHVEIVGGMSYIEIGYNQVVHP